MNFSPFFYKVQSYIKHDNDIELLKIIKSPDSEVKEEFHSYYEDLLHCTYPNRFKCLYVLLNEVNKRYNLHSVFSQCFKDNNLEWLGLFLETLQKKKNQYWEILNGNGNGQYTDKLRSNYLIMSNNLLSMSRDIDYFHLLNSSEPIWELMFKHNNCELFKPHMLVAEIFEQNKLEKLNTIDVLCEKYKVELPIKNIISNAFAFEHLDIVEHYLQKYQPSFDNNDTTDLLNTVALHGNKELFQYFVQHFLSFEEFSVEQISLSFNSGLIVNKTDILSYLKDNHNIDFYPQDKNLKKDFIKVRYTMWDDNDENTPATLELLKNINNLFDLYHWNKQELIEEIQNFSEIKKLFDNILLNSKLNSKLSVKNISSQKGKI